jgi:hypothetical protein
MLAPIASRPLGARLGSPRAARPAAPPARRAAPARRAPRPTAVARPRGGGAAAAPGGAPAPASWLGDRVASLRAAAAPFSDPAANARMLALATAQALCSVATLIHDTYLPVYLSDVLHLSNASIGNLQAVAQFLAKASGSVSGVLADVLTPVRARARSRRLASPF